MLVFIKRGEDNLSESKQNHNVKLDGLKTKKKKKKANTIGWARKWWGSIWKTQRGRVDVVKAYLKCSEN